jgi:hypothetical protein
MKKHEIESLLNEKAYQPKKNEKVDDFNNRIGPKLARKFDKNEVEEILKQAKERHFKVEKPEQKKDEAVDMGRFVSLKKDIEAGYYKVVEQGGAKIKTSQHAKDFKEKTGDTIGEAVLAAINGLDTSGSSKEKNSRHDFQPSSPGVHNLQVQLGGSTDYRRGMGDTSATLVVINEELFNAMRKANNGRLKDVLKAAHKLSYNKQKKVEIQKK